MISCGGPFLANKRQSVFQIADNKYQEVFMISTYNQLCPVIFGPDAALETGKRVKELNGRNVMCIFDKGVESRIKL